MSTVHIVYVIICCLTSEARKELLFTVNVPLEFVTVTVNWKDPGLRGE